MEPRTQYIEDEQREMRIKHWERQLSDASQAVYVAQRQLETLYRQRYEVEMRYMGREAVAETVLRDNPQQEI